jgi:peroxiredoxin
MNHDTYLILSTALVAGAFIACCVAASFFLLAAFGWRGPNRRKRLIRASMFLLLAPALVAGQLAVAHLIFLPSLREYEPPAEEVNDGFYTNVGDVAPPFIVTDDGGSIVDLDALRGNVVLLNFFGIDCKPCVVEMPYIQRIFDGFCERSDFKVIAITTFDTRGAVSAFKSEHDLTFPIAVDSTAKSFRKYASPAVPRTYVISRDGKIAFQSLGFNNDDEHKDLITLETAIKRELDEHPE